MLRTKRKEKHLTLLYTAKKLRISEGYVSKLENHPGKCNPTVNLILEIAKLLEINPIIVFKFFIKDKRD